MKTKTDDIKLPPLPAVPAADHYSSTIVVTLEQAEDAIRAAVEADRQRRVPSVEELDDLSDEFHGYSGNHTRDGYLIPKFDHIGYARALLCRYGSGQPAASPAGSPADSIGFCSFDPDDRFYHAKDRTWWRRDDDGMLVRAEAPQPAASAGPVAHTDDDAVDQFAVAMKAKLAQARAKGRHGWQECDPSDLSQMLRAHVEKGDPRDVANFCCFLWSLGKPISTAPVAQEPIHQFRTRNCSDWYDGLPDTSDGKDYETRTLYAAPVVQEPVAADIDVRKIMLRVVPGDDGMGHEVYAKSVDEVASLLGEMGEELEDWRLGIRRFASAVPVAQKPVGTLECHLSGEATFWPSESAVAKLPVGEHPVYAAPVAAQAQPSGNSRELPSGFNATIKRALVLLHDSGVDQDKCDAALNWLTKPRTAQGLEGLPPLPLTSGWEPGCPYPDWVNNLLVDYARAALAARASLTPDMQRADKRGSESARAAKGADHG